MSARDRDDDSPDAQAAHEDRHNAFIARDAYDEAAFARALAGHPALREAVEAGERLVPGFRTLVHDVHSVLFKYAIVVQDGPSSRVLARHLLGWVRNAPGFARLSAETTLDEARAAEACARLTAQMLGLVRDAELFDADDLLAGFEIDRIEDELTKTRALREALEETEDDAPQAPAADADEDTEGGASAPADADGEAGPPTPPTSGAPGKAPGQTHMRAALLDQEAALRSALRAAIKAQQRFVEKLPARVQSQLRASVEQLPDALQEAEEAADVFADALGLGGGDTSLTTKLELGRRLANNDKLEKLARLVGAFRPYALGLTRRRFERRAPEVFDLELGRALDRLVPSELVHLRHPVLRREFARRFAEGQLVSYAVAGEDKAGKGPMVLCVDGSSSMVGPKELWAKAVGLTLMDLCRRRRRAVRALVFSASAGELRRFDLLDIDERRGVLQAAASLPQAAAFADYFPRGGTRFEEPLEAAVEALSEARLRRGDIVLITDGEASVRPEWVRWFEERKRTLGFSLHAVLVDLHAYRSQALEAIADRVTRVSELTAHAADDLFRAA